MDELREEVAEITTATFEEIGDLMGSSAGNGDRRNQGRSMTLAGMIAAIRRRPGKGAFIALTDGTARIELAVFERLFQDVSDHLAGGEVIVVRGEVGFGDYGGGGRCF